LKDVKVGDVVVADQVFGYELWGIQGPVAPDGRQSLIGLRQSVLEYHAAAHAGVAAIRENIDVTKQAFYSHEQLRPRAERLVTVLVDNRLPA
jgi:hypothetical protein